ncbi:MAG: GNAT family N-acetyltransferase [Candidatus Limnocylindrales bacterium]
MSDHADIHILDVTETPDLERLPPCADPRFDHRSCDYWEDEVRGAKDARPAWWQPTTPKPKPKPRPRSDNPFAPRPGGEASYNPFDPSAATAEPAFNPFAPEPEGDAGGPEPDAPAKLRLLRRGRHVFGSYAKVLLQGDDPAAYAQFGPLSAYPRAQAVRELYPALPSSPLPAVITCIATTSKARGRGLARALIDDVVADLATRGFAAVEAYPDLTLAPDEASAASPAFWEACGFEMAAPDERYPVMRREFA